MYLGTEASGWLNQRLTREVVDPATGTAERVTDWRTFWLIPAVSILISVVLFVVLFHGHVVAAVTAATEPGGTSPGRLAESEGLAEPRALKSVLTGISRSIPSSPLCDGGGLWIVGCDHRGEIRMMRLYGLCFARVSGSALGIFRESSAPFEKKDCLDRRAAEKGFVMLTRRVGFLPLLFSMGVALHAQVLPSAIKPYPLPARTAKGLVELAGESDVLILGEMHGSQEVPAVAAALLGPLTKLGYGRWRWKCRPNSRDR